MDTLVCIFLRGGADTLNMVLPYGDDDYYKMRPTIGIAKPGSQTNGKAALRLNDTWAFHPMMAPLLKPFHDGRLAVVQGVGSDNTSGSHFSAQDQMEHGESEHRTAGGGWLGRYLVTIKEPLTALSAVAIGPSVPESLRGAPSVSAMRSLSEVVLRTPRTTHSAVEQALEQLYAADTSAMISSAGRDTLGLMQRVATIQQTTYTPLTGVNYPDTEFAEGLKEIARLVKANVGLRVATIDLGGWDTHFVQGAHEGLQAGLIEQFANALSAFDADMADVRDTTHAVVLTEFGRRTYENSSLGTDHGRGFAAFVLSSKVNGGQIIGEYKGLAEQTAEFVLGPAGLQITRDYRSLLANILENLLACRETEVVFPGLPASKFDLTS